jgi:hypothetical protein
MLEIFLLRRQAMAITLEKFLFCLELQLGGIIMGWWGMVISALAIIGVVFGAFFDGGHFIQNFFPFHVGRGGSLVGAVLAILFLVVYFYFSYQLLLGAQSVSSEIIKT